MPLSLTVSCFSKIQIGFTFLVPAHPGSPGKTAVKRVCVLTLPLVVGWVGSVSPWVGLDRVTQNEPMDNSALPAFAAAAHAAATSAVQQSTDIFYQPGPQQQTRRALPQRTNETYRQTDGRKPNRFTDPVLRSKKSKSKRIIAVGDLPHRYRNSHAIWDHTVLPATRQR